MKATQLIKRALRDPVEVKKAEVQRLMKKLGRAAKIKGRLNQAEERIVAGLRLKNTEAQKGAERSYQLTRLQLMERFIQEEISVYDGSHPNLSPEPESGSEGGTDGMAGDGEGQAA